MSSKNTWASNIGYIWAMISSAEDFFMNIKQMIIPIFIIIMGITKNSFSMNKSNIIKAAILPTSGAIISAKKYRDYKQDLTGTITEYRWPQPAISWIEKIKHNVDIKLPTEYVRFNKSDGHPSGFYTIKDHIIAADYETVEKINNFVKKPINTDRDHEELATESVLIKHEFGHIKSNDSWKKIKASFVIPTTIQTGFSGIYYCFDKIFPSRKSPTKINAYTKSAAAIIALWIKIIVWDISEKTYYRYLEKNADQFALEHATQEEIAAFIKIIKKNEEEMLQHPDYKDIAHDETEIRKTFFYGKDPHSFPADRIAMAEKYLKKTE